MMNTTLEQEFKAYLRQKNEFAKKYDGKLIVLKNGEVIGVFDNYEEAAAEVFPHHERGTVLFQQISKDPDANVAHFYSPGVYAPR